MRCRILFSQFSWVFVLLVLLGTPTALICKRHAKKQRVIFDSLSDSYSALFAKMSVLSLRFSFLRHLSSGRHGTVYGALDTLEHHAPRAVKMLLKSRHDIEPSDNLQMIRTEIYALKQLQLPRCRNIVTLYDILEDANAYYIVQELGEPAMKSSSRACLRPVHAVSMLRDVANALKTCHDTSIVYGDLKPENVIFVESDRAYKLVDFGSSVQVEQVPEERLSVCTSYGRLAWTTPKYVAPETLSYNGLASAKSDVYSFGIMVNDVIDCCEPLRSDPAIAELLGRCLHPDPELRCSVRDVLRQLDNIRVKP
jgi:serine/threonine protein kinase